MRSRVIKLDSHFREPLNRKKVLVLSDRDMLYDVIKINLEKIPATVVRFEEETNGNSSRANNIDQFNLIVVASGSSTSEPLIT